MSRPTPGSNNQESDAINSAQIYTLAHAVRSNKKKSLEKTQFPFNNLQLPIKEEISMQIKRELKKNLKTIVPRQPRSHLPMKMIVSKMATRKRPNDENEDPASKLDLSTYRQYQLEPPPWRNALHSTRRQRPSEFEKLLSSIKEKYAELDTSSQRSCPMRKGEPDLKQRKLECLLSDSNLSGCDVLNTPRLDFNYNQLYRGTNVAKENHITSEVLDEDPLGIDSRDHQTTEVGQVRDTSSPTNVAIPDNTPEFVWNPVVLYDSSKSQLFPMEDTEIEHQLSSPQQPPLNYCQELPSCFDSPTWESSSTCSEHTVAEERLQLTIFANRGDMSILGSDYLRRSHSPTNPWN